MKGRGRNISIHLRRVLWRGKYNLGKYLKIEYYRIKENVRLQI